MGAAQDLCLIELEVLGPGREANTEEEFLNVFKFYFLNYYKLNYFF